MGRSRKLHPRLPFKPTDIPGLQLWLDARRFVGVDTDYSGGGDAVPGGAVGWIGNVASVSPAVDSGFSFATPATLSVDGKSVNLANGDGLETLPCISGHQATLFMAGDLSLISGIILVDHNGVNFDVTTTAGKVVTLSRYSDAGTTTVSGAASASGDHVLTVTAPLGGGVASIYIDGVVGGTPAAVPGAGLGGSSFRLGFSSVAPLRMYEMLLYSSVLGLADIKRVERYLGSRHGITIH